MNPQPDREFKEKLIVSGLLIFTITFFIYLPLMGMMDWAYYARPFKHGTWIPILCTIPLIVGIGYRLSKCTWSWRKVIISSILLGISLPISSFPGIGVYAYYWLNPVIFSLFFLLCMRIALVVSPEQE